MRSENRDVPFPKKKVVIHKKGNKNKRGGQVYFLGMTSREESPGSCLRNWVKREIERKPTFALGKEQEMNSLKGINEILKTHKEDLYKKYNVTEIGVFGSFVRGEHKKRSDITLVQNRILNAETQRTQRNQFFIWR